MSLYAIEVLYNFYKKMNDEYVATPSVLTDETVDYALDTVRRMYHATVHDLTFLTPTIHLRIKLYARDENMRMGDRP